MKRVIVLLVSLAGLVAYQGCDGSGHPPLGQVTGTVTLDGKPVPDVRVAFEPAGAAASSGVTDASGKYTLFYAKDVKGAVIGKHVVRIEPQPPDPAMMDKAVQIPMKYSLESMLSEEVKAGQNTINLDLKSK